MLLRHPFFVSFLCCTPFHMYDSDEDFACYIVGELYDLDCIMGNLSNYLDYKAFARDLFLSYYIFDDGYVFRR